MKKGDLAHLAISGTVLAVHVTPNASRNVVLFDGGKVQVRVTLVPEEGRATATVLELLAEALGLPKSRLSLVRGGKSREKLFRIEG